MSQKFFDDEGALWLVVSRMGFINRSEKKIVLNRDTDHEKVYLPDVYELFRILHQTF